MINKLRLLVFVGAALLTATAGATSLNGNGAMQAYGTQQMEYMGDPVTPPLGGDPNQYSADIFVRGSFNDWGNSGLTDQMIYQGDGIYTAVISIVDADFYEFKIASADWSAVNLGCLTNGETRGAACEAFAGVPLLLENGENPGNIGWNAGVGDYLFTLDTDSDLDRSLSFPLLTITLVQPTPSPGTLALIGLGLVVFVVRKRSK